MASVWPMTPPAKREKCDQLVPNWNSMGIDAKDASPEASRLIVSLVVAAQRERLEDHNQRRQPHSQLRKQIVKSNGKREVMTVNKKSTIHRILRRILPRLRSGMCR